MSSSDPNPTTPTELLNPTPLATPTPKDNPAATPRYDLVKFAATMDVEALRATGEFGPIGSVEEASTLREVEGEGPTQAKGGEGGAEDATLPDG